ncbi:N-acetylmuramoyl-L-alanine amidase [Desulforamulus reducens MI-1]|uniref:N-acetylmuramoyl-L-alanine amidase n=1 Tax=Desulforamulus reducens (strain ATCC BAA-1160 / DSM 100696 / MI-1) TaxID=349161 RepID=A4J6T8_DESRM|nr:N-acetylmuramoyl-L-alanine amidase [Desulforamulus reducens]ABO50791.1 N-acetylmuramoyl-L-alanine amidase [Desulforamulus reducens MI-1]
MTRKIICLDPGHGGQDPGALGNGLQEKDITLEIAKKIIQRLAAYDVTVKSTRDSDTFVSLSQRAAYANNVNADYFVSIHINAGGGTGFESFIYNGEVSSTTIKTRQVLHDTIMADMQKYYMIDRGKKAANFAVIRETNMPAILTENLFIDNPKDASLLKNTDFINDLSTAITHGLVKGLNLTPLTIIPNPTPAPLPTKPPVTPQPPVWNPQAEIQQLIDTGLLANNHPADEHITWGEFATVINRLLYIIKNKS